MGGTAKIKGKEMDISIIDNKSGCRAIFYYKGKVYTCYANTPKEARIKAELKLKTLKGEALF